MNVENPAALRFIMQDDIYLLHNDKIAVDKLPAETVIETPVLAFNYLGSHKKKLLIITHYPDNEFIADAHLTALGSILKRKEYEIDDVAILNLAAHTGTDFTQLQTYFAPQKILILGENALPVNIEPLALNQLKQLTGCVALYSFSFDEMMANTDYKKAFWDQMKNL